MGRRKGVPNKATAAKAAAVARSGLTPLDFMLKTMRNDKLDKAVRMDAAKSAAPYVHPKLAAVEHTTANGAPILSPANVDPVDLAKRVAFLLQQGLAAKP